MTYIDGGTISFINFVQYCAYVHVGFFCVCLNAQIIVVFFLCELSPILNRQ